MEKLICAYCKEGFNRRPQHKRRNHNNFCGLDCFKKFFTLPNINCLNCNRPFKPRWKTRKFCSQSCAATYSNTHKTKGTRISKLEKYLQTELPKIYTFEIKFNSKKEINSELDIYIPSLKLAFELNGVFHYEPIFGKKKLLQIQNNDDRKFQACIENNIELCIIDVSRYKYFKKTTAKQFLDIICCIITRAGTET